MAINLSPEQKTQIEKILSYIEKMETIVRTSPNEEQKTRVKKELFRHHKKLSEIDSQLDLTKLDIKTIRQLIGGVQKTASGDDKAQAPNSGSSDSGDVTFRVLDKITIELASPGCQDNDVNFLSSIYNTINEEYWPSLSDRHTKLDFSNAQERDGIRIEIDNVMRNLGVLLETIEEFSKSEKQDFREQLLKMKNRQTRTFIYEANQALKKQRAFLRKLSEDVNGRGGIVMNKDDKIKFNAKFEKSTILEGYTVAEAVIEFSSLVTESISHLNLPEMKIKT